MRAEAAARVIENVAASVADGVRIDWDTAGAEVAGREERLIRHLRLIDSVATVYRTLPPVDDEDAIHAAAPDYPDGPRWGRLILLDRIGSGTSADVYRAWDAELQRDVALKLLRDDAGSDAAANARLLQEARRLARIKHPHVVNVYGAERHESRIGLWMELVRGRSLDDTVRQEGPFAFAEAARIGMDLCSALAAVHAAGLLHRDVKAQNVVREETGRTVLMDFGTGEELSHGRPRLAGTPLYLAPEVLAGQPATVRTDLYGVGVLLFYLVTGQFPVEGDSLDGIADAHRDRRVRALRDVRADAPESFARAIDAALSPEPSARYTSASSMEAALRQAIDARPVKRSARLPWALTAVTVAAVLALIGVLIRGSHRTAGGADGIKSVAVLPLKLISGGADATYLADGLTDQLITTLGQDGSLRVIAYQSVARFKDTSLATADVARQLGVDGIVEGSVSLQRETGGRPARARVNVRVIRAGSDFDVWSGSLERPLGDMLVLESELAHTITRQIHGALAPDAARWPGGIRQTSAAAEQAYLEGRSRLAGSSARAKLALEAFRRALRLDPLHAGAHAGAARSYVDLALDNVITYDEARASAMADVSQALQLDPNVAEAHAVLANLEFYFDWDWSAADREYQRAIALEPSSTYARSQYARYLAAAQRLDEAVGEATQAASLDPLSAEAAVTRGLMLHYARRHQEAEAVLEHALQLEPGSAGARFVLGRVHEAEGRLDAAIADTDDAIRATDHFSVAWNVQAIGLRARAGRMAEARTRFAALTATLQREGRRLNPEYEAKLWLSFGDRNRGCALIDQAVTERDPAVLWFAVDPRLDPYRNDPVFASAIARLGIPPRSR